MPLAEYKTIIRGYMPCFSIHSSVSGPSATINNASTSMGIQISFYDADFSLDKHPEIELLDPMAVLFFFFFFFEEPPYCFL